MVSNIGQIPTAIKTWKNPNRSLILSCSKVGSSFQIRSQYRQRMPINMPPSRTDITPESKTILTQLMMLKGNMYMSERLREKKTLRMINASRLEKKTHIQSPMHWTIKLALLIFGGNIAGGPGSLKVSALLWYAAAIWSILWLDSTMASADRSSKVTRSTTKLISIRNSCKRVFESDEFM